MTSRSEEQSETGLRRELRLRDVVFLNICAIASLRWISAAAHSGAGSLLLWIVAAVFFFVPSAIVVARLSAKFPQEGGLYVWTRQAFGERHAFLCAWFYFVSNLVFLPSLVLAGISMTAYLFGSTGARLADDRAFVIPVTFGVLWILFLVNFLGLKVAKWVAAFGGISLFVIAGLLVLLAVLVGFRNGSATHVHIWPEARLDTLNFWSQIAFAFVGLELAPVMSGEIRNPQRDIRSAAIISGIACTLFYIAGTAALLVILKPSTISPVAGLAQAGAAAAQSLGMPVIGTCFVALIAFGFAGSLDTWIAGNTRLPYVIGLDNYLPAAFGRIHKRFGSPYIALLVQVVASSVFLLMCELGETVRAAYQILVDMTIIATFIPFLYIFGSGFRFLSRFAAISGLAVTAIAILFSAVPPAEVASPALFEVKIIGGLVVFWLAGWILFERYRSRRVQVASTPALAS